MTRAVTRRVLAVAVLSVLSFTLFAACGGDDDDDGADNGAALTVPDDDGDNGGDDDDGGTTETGDGCDLVTSADAEDILGEPVEQEEGTTGQPADLMLAECIWGASDENSVGLVQFRIWNGPQFFGKEAFSAEEGFEEVDGVGDDAFFTGTNLQVLVDDVVIDIAPSGRFDDETPVKDKVVELARGIVEQIS